MRDKESPMERYFKEYRKKLEEVKQIRVKHQGMMDELSSMSEKLTNAERDLHGMKRVISKMIDEDLDPIEAKLSIDDADDASIWQNQGIEISYDPSPSYGNGPDSWSIASINTNSYSIKT